MIARMNERVADALILATVIAGVLGGLIFIVLPSLAELVRILQD